MGGALIVERSEVVSNVRLKLSLRLWPGMAPARKPSNDAGSGGLRSKVGSCALRVTVDLPLPFKKFKPPRRQPGVDAQSRPVALFG
jgi:hypothetical protein